MQATLSSCIGRMWLPKLFPKGAFSARKSLKTGWKLVERREPDEPQGGLPLTGIPRPMGVFDPVGTPAARRECPISSAIVTAFSHWPRRSIPGDLRYCTKDFDKWSVYCICLCLNSRDPPTVQICRTPV